MSWAPHWGEEESGTPMHPDCQYGGGRRLDNEGGYYYYYYYYYCWDYATHGTNRPFP